MNKKIGGYGIVIESWKEFPKSAFAVLTCTWHVREIREEKKLKGFQEGHWLFASRTLSKVDDDKNLDTRIMNHVKHHPCYNIFCIVTCTCLLRVATCYISIRSNDVPVLLLGLLFNFTNVIISKKKKKSTRDSVRIVTILHSKIITYSRWNSCHNRLQSRSHNAFEKVENM